MKWKDKYMNSILIKILDNNDIDCRFRLNGIFKYECTPNVKCVKCKENSVKYLWVCKVFKWIYYHEELFFFILLPLTLGIISVLITLWMFSIDIAVYVGLSIVPVYFLILYIIANLIDVK